MLYVDYTAAAPAFRAALDEAQTVLLLTHVNPDGDAIGSLLGVWHALAALGKTPIGLASSAVPSYTAQLPGIDQVQVYQRNRPLPKADLVWLMDTATVERIGPVYHDHAEELRNRKIIIVDHHVTNDGTGAINLINADAASTAELLLRLLQAMNLPVSAATATCLMMGLMSDTQSLQTSSITAETLEIAAELLRAGADHQLVVKALYLSTPFSSAQLSGMVLGSLRREGALVWSAVTQAMLRTTGAEDEASDEAIRHMQRIDGMRVCALFKERFDGTVKLSLRSVPGINVAAIAQMWGGGGHTQASGATLNMSLAEAESTVLPVLRDTLK